MEEKKHAKLDAKVISNRDSFSVHIEFSGIPEETSEKNSAICQSESDSHSEPKEPIKSLPNTVSYGTLTAWFSMGAGFLSFFSSFLTAMYWSSELDKPSLFGTIFNKISAQLSLSVFVAITIIFILPVFLATASRILNELEFPKRNKDSKAPNGLVMSIVASLIFAAATYSMKFAPLISLLIQFLVLYVYALIYTFWNRFKLLKKANVDILISSALLPLSAMMTELFLLILSKSIASDQILFTLITALIILFLLSVYNYFSIPNTAFLTSVALSIVFICLAVSSLQWHLLERVIVYKYGGEPRDFTYTIYRRKLMPEKAHCKYGETFVFLVHQSIYFKGKCRLGESQKYIETKGVMFSVGKSPPWIYHDIKTTPIHVAYPRCRWSGTGKDKYMHLVCAVPRPFVG